MARAVRINCKDKDWPTLLKNNLQEGLEVDLINFDYSLDGHICELLAVTHNRRFELDSKNSAGFFKKRKPDA